MLINSVASSSGVMQQNIKKTDDKILAAISSLVSGQQADDVANLAVATQLQSRVAGLRQVSQSIAQASSLTQVANGALEQVQRINDRLTQIAQQAANGATNQEQRAQLDQEFQELVKELDSQVAKTQFNGQNLLDGTLAGDNKLSLNRILATEQGEDSALEVQDLSSTVLFNGERLNVLSADSAQAAIAKLQDSGQRIATARSAVGSFEQTLNYSAATIDTAIANQQAAQSLLSDSDFLSLVTESQQEQVKKNGQLALLAQGNRLPNSFLQLIS
jgi:flagellin